AQKNWKDSRFVISAGGKAQDVGHGVAPAIPPVERPHPAIRDDRNVDGPTRLGRCDPDQPRSQTARSQTPSLIVGDRAPEPPPRPLLPRLHRSQEDRPDRTAGRTVALPFSSSNASYAFTICCTSLCRTTSRSSKYTNEMPSIALTTFMASTSPDTRPIGRSICVTSPVMTAFAPKP